MRIESIAVFYETLPLSLLDLIYGIKAAVTAQINVAITDYKISP